MSINNRVNNIMRDLNKRLKAGETRKILPLLAALKTYMAPGDYQDLADAIENYSNDGETYEEVYLSLLEDYPPEVPLQRRRDQY